MVTAGAPPPNPAELLESHAMSAYSGYYASAPEQGAGSEIGADGSERP